MANKEKWTDKRELTNAELEQVTGGSEKYHISCSNPSCKYYRSTNI